jgi:hypothetical protein
MDKAKQWQGAEVGTERFTLRVTDEERDRLEQLRRSHGLTSKAQVLRFALDLLEVVAAPGTFVVEGRKGLKQNADTIERAKERWASDRASSGLPADALSDAPGVDGSDD